MRRASGAGQAGAQSNAVGSAHANGDQTVSASYNKATIATLRLTLTCLDRIVLIHLSTCTILGTRYSSRRSSSVGGEPSASRKRTEQNRTDGVVRVRVGEAETEAESRATSSARKGSRSQCAFALRNIGVAMAVRLIVDWNCRALRDKRRDARRCAAANSRVSRTASCSFVNLGK